MTNKYIHKNCKFYEIERQELENIIVELLSVKSISELNFYWFKAHTDESFANIELELKKITKNLSDSVEEIVYLDDCGYTVERDKKSLKFFADIKEKLESKNPKIDKLGTFRVLSVTNPFSIEGFINKDYDCIKSNCILEGKPTEDKYIFISFEEKN